MGAYAAAAAVAPAAKPAGSAAPAKGIVEKEVDKVMTKYPQHAGMAEMLTDLFESVVSADNIWSLEKEARKKAWDATKAQVGNMVSKFKKKKGKGSKKPTNGKGPASPKGPPSKGPQVGTGKPASGPGNGPKGGPPKKNGPPPQKKSSWGSWGSKFASWGSSLKSKWGKKPAIATKPAATTPTTG